MPCYSAVQANALLDHIDCVVGMRSAIRDDAARSFAIGFYGGLGERESVAAAYRQGCAAIILEGLPDADRPQLAVREGVDPEHVVLAANISPTARAATSAADDGEDGAPLDSHASELRSSTASRPGAPSRERRGPATLVPGALTIVPEFDGTARLAPVDRWLLDELRRFLESTP